MAHNEANEVANIDAGEIVKYGILLDYVEDRSDQIIVIRESTADIEIYLNYYIEQLSFCPFCPFCSFFQFVQQTHTNRNRHKYEQEQEEEEEVPYYIWDNPIQSNLI